MSHRVGGNELRLLQSGAEYFPALLIEIARARREVHLETYIFEDDATGRSVAAALGEAATRGVAVRVLVDGFGARGFDQGLGQRLIDQGVELLVYRPEAARLELRRHRLRRLHRKLSVFDGAVAFVGGINVIDDSNTPHQVPPRFDYAVRIEGPLAGEVHHALRHVWQLVRWVHVGRRPPPPPVLPPRASSEGRRIALVIRDNLRHRHDIEEAYLAAIAAARESLIIANAYFLPGRRFRAALIQAARRGVRVTLLLQGRVEYVLLHYATLALYGILLKAGVRIVEYHTGFLHAKVAVADNAWATVGSSNIDPFSLLLAREANIVVRDAGFASELRSSLEAAMAVHGVPISTGDLKRRPWYVRLFSRFAFGAIRFLMGMTGYIAKSRKR